MEINLTQKIQHRVITRKANQRDVDSILKIENDAWGLNAATREMVFSRINTFPEGVIVAEKNNNLVGVVFTEIIDWSVYKNKDSFTWYEVTDNGLILKTHNRNGDTLYGVGLSVMNAYRGEGIGTELLRSIARLIVSLRLKRGVLGGRVPYYHKFNHYSIDDYLKAVDQDGNILDPELRLYKRSGLKIIKPVKNYFNDPESLNWGILLSWENPVYILSWIPFLAKIFEKSLKLNI